MVDNYIVFFVYLTFVIVQSQILKATTLGIHKAWFPYDRPDRPSRLKKCSDDRDDHMETLSDD